jgi:hypothetical protein
VRLVPLTSLLAPTSEIYVLKVDTEGHELRVLQGALPFFEQRSIRHAFVEFTPELWPRLQHLARLSHSTVFTLLSYSCYTDVALLLVNCAVLLHFCCTHMILPILLQDAAQPRGSKKVRCTAPYTDYVIRVHLQHGTEQVCTHTHTFTHTNTHRYTQILRHTVHTFILWYTHSHTHITHTQTHTHWTGP